MSFTAEVREELARVEPTCPDCDKAELAAIVRTQGTIGLSGGGRTRLEIATEIASVARVAIRMLHDVYGLETELTVRRNVLHRTHNYLITVPGQLALSEALHDLGMLGDEGFMGGVPQKLVAKKCCAAAYLRGMFLVGGYIADPHGDFHFELTTASESLARDVVELMKRHDIDARSIRRHNTYTIYLKGAEHIISFLVFVGAQKSALVMESARVIKSVRNDTNRRVNAEIANQNKASEAALKQIESIRILIENDELDDLPASLREIALLRLRNPDTSLKDLGELANPPLSKSAVYHRLLRINAIAEGVAREV